MEKALNAIKEVGKENGFTYIFDYECWYPVPLKIHRMSAVGKEKKN